MKGILFFLSELNDNDIDWLLTKGHKRRLPVGMELIRKGKGHDHLHFILQGQFSLMMEEQAPGKVARLGPGGVVGESCFVESQTRPGTVRALTPSVVLSVPVMAVTSKITEDAGFSERFHRALTKLLAHRRSGRVAHKIAAAGGNVELPPDQLDMNVMDSLHLGGARFKHILARLLPA